jgi:hypothetical protein
LVNLLSEVAGGGGDEKEERKEENANERGNKMEKGKLENKRAK